ncbi:MAG: hypothetical protein IT559_05365 [Alphaproteobacteria bacterium]|nr:hypothetical protein [Alphaproteobacteria bacterium]
MPVKKIRPVMFFAILGCTSLLSLSACAPGKSVHDIDGQFWQRSSMSEAVYAQGPKAQQMLNRDISRCVFEVRELQRLGVTKNAIPTDYHGRVLDPDELALYDHDSPERDKHLLAEHGNYVDFESCMNEKGWERVEHVPFEVAARGRDNYRRAHVKYKDVVDPQKQAKKASLSERDSSVGKLNN